MSTLPILILTAAAVVAALALVIALRRRRLSASAVTGLWEVASFSGDVARKPDNFSFTGEGTGFDVTGSEYVTFAYSMLPRRRIEIIQDDTSRIYYVERRNDELVLVKDGECIILHLLGL